MEHEQNNAWPSVGEWKAIRKELDMDFIYRDDLIEDLVEEGYCHVRDVGTYYLSPDSDWLQFTPSTKLQADIKKAIQERTDDST